MRKELDYDQLQSFADAHKEAIPGYTLDCPLEHEAVAMVFEGFDTKREQAVAIKILDQEMAKIPEAREAFLAETKAVMRLNHPNIVSGRDSGEADGLVYFVMDLVDGRSIQELVASRGPMDERQALNIIRDIARALEHAEEHGMVHRDIKPANIAIGSNRVAVLLDFGLAKLVVGAGAQDAERGAAVGTPNYMSPEQIRGESALTTGSDIYSLGATLYFMMTGQAPFEGKPEVIMYKHIHEPPASPRNIRPDCSMSIANLVFSMMAKRPEDRPSTASALIEEIDSALAQVGKAIAPAPPMILPTPEPIEPAGPEIRIPTRGRGGRKRKRRPINPSRQAEAAPEATPLEAQPAPVPIPIDQMEAPKPVPIPKEQLGQSAPLVQPTPEMVQPAPDPIQKIRKRRRRNMR